jgi:hypothetical protein
MLGLERHEFGDGAEIIAEMEIAGRLHPGEDAGPGLGFLHVLPLRPRGLWLKAEARRKLAGAVAREAGVSSGDVLEEIAKSGAAEEVSRAEIGRKADADQGEKRRRLEDQTALRGESRP